MKRGSGGAVDGMLALQDNVRQLEALLDTDDRVIALHTTDAETALVVFRLLCRRTGRSVYHWAEDQGIISLKAADISVPGCRKLLDAMRYVLQSMHYGVYLFTRFERQMRPAVIDRMAEIALLQEQRTVILIGDRIDLPRRISGHVRHVRFQDTDRVRTRPRLRDGRWIV